MTATPRLALTELAAAQDNAEVAVNEMVRWLEAFATRIIVKERDNGTPPGAPAEGDAYFIPAAGTTGVWVGKEGKIALRLNGAWAYLTPKEGFAIEDEESDSTYVLRGGTWVNVNPTGGVFDVPIMAAAMTPRTTLGAAPGSSESGTNKVMASTLDFDPAADEFAQFMFPMEKSWNESTITAKFIWTAAAGTVTQVARWGIQAMALADNEVIDTAFGTGQEVDDALLATNKVHHSAFTAAMTVGDSPADRDLVVFQVYRNADHANDTLSGDAQLIGVVLRITTNAADDS